jgi:poly(3-hydroxybutyrate) depolymerase
MIERAAIDFAAGRSRIFISGLSAGAAILPLRLRRICAGGIEAMFNVSSMPSSVS